MVTALCKTIACDLDFIK